MAGLQSYEELDANLKEYTEQLQQVCQIRGTVMWCTAALCWVTKPGGICHPMTFATTSKLAASCPLLPVAPAVVRTALTHGVDGCGTPGGAAAPDGS